MAVTYESSNSAAVLDAALVITKPTGLAVGDVMLAGIEYSDDGIGGGGINTPSGWTLLNTLTNDTDAVTAYFQKIADSADVAASNFTFTRSGFDSAYHMIGHLIRISGCGSLVGSSYNLTASLGSTTITATTFTPTKSETLFVGFLLNVGAGGISNTSIGLATDNPTWTERNETTRSDSSRTSTFSFYTATRAAMTATGTITGTFGSSVGTWAQMIVYAFSQRVDGSVSPVTYVNAYAINPNIPYAAAVDAIVENPTTLESNPITWTPITKSNTHVWTPITKL